jgi:Flp pilus assembly pilin Flp
MNKLIKKLKRLHLEESGAATAEYAITILAATGFAGLLIIVLSSDTVKGWLEGIIEKALNR